MTSTVCVTQLMYPTCSCGQQPLVIFLLLRNDRDVVHKKKERLKTLPT